METNLTTLIEEQKKEALKLYTTGGSTIQSVGGETTLHTDTHTILTTAITKGYELALEEVDENTSDGYHTFKELYEYRKLYNAVLFNEWASQKKYGVIKSKKHSDGEDCFGGGWFIVMAITPAGQISNHYELKDWDLFQCEETLTGYPYDGHTPQDVAERLTHIAHLKKTI